MQSLCGTEMIIGFKSNVCTAERKMLSKPTRLRLLCSCLVAVGEFVLPHHGGGPYGRRTIGGERSGKLNKTLTLKMINFDVCMYANN